MKKIYFIKLLFAVSLLMMVSSLVFAQPKSILFIGKDTVPVPAPATDIRPADAELRDSLIAWGFDVSYLGVKHWQEAANPYFEIDVTFFSESVGSGDCNRFGPGQDNFPTDFVCHEAAVFNSERWDLLAPDGGILVNDGEIATEDDRIMKVKEANHYVTRGLTPGSEIQWTTADPLLVPYMHGFKYNYVVLCEPKITQFNDVSQNPPNIMTMGIMEDFTFPKVMGFFGMTHSLIEYEQGTPEFWRLTKRMVRYVAQKDTVDPSGIEEKLIQDDFEMFVTPNPAVEYLTVRIEAQRPGNITVSLYNVTGQKLDVIVNEYAHTGNNWFNYNVSNYSKGIYFLKLEADNRSQYIKLLVQ